MVRCPRRLHATALLLAAGLFAPPLRAFIQWDESRNQIFVNASATMAWDSNIFTASGGRGDMIYTGLVSLDYQRRAGLIGVNGTAGWTVGRFDENTDENFENPFYRLELTKDSGRTTGSLTMAAQRESRAEPDVNLRTDSWNYDGGLNVKYPVIDRYSLSGGASVSHRDYIDNRRLVDLSTHGAHADLYYVFTTDRDLIAGYRYRASETSADSRFDDHAFTVGVSGRILPKLNGTARLGYQYRYGEGPGARDDASYTASGSATWSINRRSSLTLQVSKDFGTTSSNVSVDTLAGAIDGLYIFNARLSAGGGVAAGLNRFLGPLGGGREDFYFSASASANYTFSERLRLSLSYRYYTNWSTLAISDFVRHSVSLSVSSRF